MVGFCMDYICTYCIYTVLTREAFIFDILHVELCTLIMLHCTCVLHEYILVSGLQTNFWLTRSNGRRLKTVGVSPAGIGLCDRLRFSCTLRNPITKCCFDNTHLTLLLASCSSSLKYLGTAVRVKHQSSDSTYNRTLKLRNEGR